MGLFGKRVSIQESDAYALQALGTGVLRLDEDARNRIGPVMVAVAIKHLKNQTSYSEEHRNSALTMFRIISGTVGVEPVPEIDTYGDEADEVRGVIESTLPINVPLAVVGAMRMVIEEFITGKEFNDISMEKFDKHDARQVVHAIMEAVNIVNERCVKDPRKHTQNEVLCLATLAVITVLYTKKYLPFK
jgi:hypothetical protein